MKVAENIRQLGTEVSSKPFRPGRDLPMWMASYSSGGILVDTGIQQSEHL